MNLKRRSLFAMLCALPGALFARSSKVAIPAEQLRGRIKCRKRIEGVMQISDIEAIRYFHRKGLLSDQEQSDLAYYLAEK